jgi:uncharacterized protein (TIGR02598 family)
MKNRHDISIHPPGCKKRGGLKKIAGFSLVEVTLALGIVSFAMVPLIGLLPVSYTSFQASTRSVTTTQLAQRIFAELQQTDFAQLAGAESFYDVQGVEVGKTDSKKVFDVRVQIVDAMKLPTSAAVAAGSLLGNTHLKQIVVQVAENPGGRSDPYSSATVPVNTYCATVSDMQ